MGLMRGFCRPLPRVTALTFHEARPNKNISVPCYALSDPNVFTYSKMLQHKRVYDLDLKLLYTKIGFFSVIRLHLKYPSVT